MANDPNRDLLPVKEDCCKVGRGFNGKFDHQALGKLTRCELEDRFLRLLDEQMHIKKLANNQEEKIKRLGTKLLRLINEKKNGRKFSEQNKETEDLHLRIIELEHENYALKDKNTVLKQQLSNHSRHILTHRSPNRSNHTSPLMTMRQSAPTTQSEMAYEAINKATAADVQLQEAEAHIRELNEEIKSLHSKIDCLQQNLEKNSLDGRKIKVMENIELIRLQRALKQQAIQISALQAQVKNSENNQKILKEELIKANVENDEALHLISVKQNEILSLCTKLEEKNLNRLEEDELRERINDLTLERDSLKERSDFLMKSIGAKVEESEKIKELQKLLAEEKCKKRKLEEALDSLKKNNFKNPESLPSEKVKTVCNRSQQTAPADKKEVVSFAGDFSEEGECFCNNCNHTLSECKCSQESFLSPGVHSDTELTKTFDGKVEPPKEDSSLEGKYAAEKMKLERELQYLKEMLRSQTSRCEAQQAEISRLMYELKFNEEKCNETLQRLDWHLRIFQTFEMSEFEAVMRAKQNERIPASVVEPVLAKPESVQEKAELQSSCKSVTPNKSKMKASPSKERIRTDSIGSKDFIRSKRKESVSEENYLPKFIEKSTPITPERESTGKLVVSEQKSRFVDQKFLESSDEELDNGETFRESFMKKLEQRNEDDAFLRKNSADRDSYESEIQFRWNNPQSKKTAKAVPEKKVSSLSWSSKFASDYSLQVKQNEKENKREIVKQDYDALSEDPQSVTINILWFKFESGSSLWKNKHVEMFFIDFTFLDVNGAETETPQSLPKPRNANEKCTFNFSQSIDICGSKKEMLHSLFNKPDLALIIFKVVSDSEKFDETNGECEDVGVAVITVKEFLEFCNKGPFNIEVKNTENTKEVVGTLAVSVEATSGIIRVKNSS